MLSDRLTIILLCVRDRKSIVDIAKVIDRSQRTVQIHLGELERLGYIANTFGPNGGGKTRGRILTPAAITLLKELGHK